MVHAAALAGTSGGVGVGGTSDYAQRMQQMLRQTEIAGRQFRLAVCRR